ncbi:MAG TPA: erythromycin esterase family protein, partial [Caulobacteraceae bacterium]|nr:erythromycin esterase family protein [Caulobacteraceae bacterium]
MHKSLIAGLASALTLGVCASSAQIQAPAAVAADEQALVERAAGARYVLLGESTHGTREYYLERARLTEALVTAHGARALAIEGDWSGAARVNRYVRGLGSDASADQAL